MRKLETCPRCESVRVRRYKLPWSGRIAWFLGVMLLVGWMSWVGLVLAFVAAGVVWGKLLPQRACLDCAGTWRDDDEEAR